MYYNLVNRHIACKITIEDLLKVIDEGKPLDMIYRDFSKAFDKVPHLRILRKIECHGISGDIYSSLDRGMVKWA